MLISSAPNGWADVFAPEDGQYDHYGYNATEDRRANYMTLETLTESRSPSPLSQKGYKDKWPFSIANILASRYPSCANSINAAVLLGARKTSSTSWTAPRG